MAIVKTLIVKGVARFLTDAYMSTIRSGIWNGSTIQVGYGGTGVTSAKGNLYTPVFLASNGITPCSVEIPHATKDFKINGVTYAVFTNSTGAAPTIFAPTTLAGTGGYILATNAAKTGLEWVAANNHTHNLYVLLDSGTAEQTIKSSINSLGNGVIELWRATSGGYPMIGFANGTTKTHLGKLGFGAEANKPIFRNTSNTDYLLAHAGNIVNDNITIALNTEKTIATIAGVAIKLKVTGTNNVTTSAVVSSSASGTTQITAAQTNPYYNLLEGGAVTRSIQFTSSNITISSTTGGVISFTAASWTGATSSAAGTAGYMPGAAAADRTKFLRGDGSWIALSLTDHTHSVKINGSTKTIAAPGGTAVDLGSYLPLTGGTMVGNIIMDTGGSTELSIYYDINRAKANGGGWAFSPMVCRDVSDQSFFNIGVHGTADVFNYAFMGTGSYNSTTNFRIYSDAIKFGNNLIAHAGNISNKSATIGSSLTEIATIAGVSIKAKIDLSSTAISASVTKTLNVDSWTEVSGFTGTGTYAIQISCGDLYASGILSGSGGGDTVVDEVPLHVTNKDVNTWRPYVRVNGSQLQMTTNEASPGTERTYTIKILKLI